MEPVRDYLLDPARRLSRSIRSRSIVLKLSLFVGMLVAVTSGILTAVVYYYTSAMLHDQINVRLSTIADDRHAFLVSGLTNIEEQIRALTTRYRLLELHERYARGQGDTRQFRAENQEVMDDVRADTPGLLAFWLEDENHREIISSGPRALITLFNDEDPRPAEADREPVMTGLPHVYENTSVALFRAAARSRTRGVIGSLMLVVDVGPIMNGLADPRRLGDTGEVLVGVQEGQSIRYLFPPRLTPQVMASPLHRNPSVARAIAGEYGQGQMIDRLGHEVLAAYRPVNYGGWGLVSKMDVAEAHTPVKRLRRLLLAIGGVISGLGLVASYLLAREYTKPVRRLASAANAVASGDLSNDRIDVNASGEIGTLGIAFTRMTEELSRTHAEMEQRIIDRTRDLEATRDLLTSFFQIFTSQVDPQNIDRTFELVLRFCQRLGYDHAMISLVDPERKIIRAGRGIGLMSDLVSMTVRSLDGDDILAVVVRQGHPVVIPDSANDPRCDPTAIGRAKIHGQIVMPLRGDYVMGTLQVATREVLNPAKVDLRPLETLASHTARALNGLEQVSEIRRLNTDLERQATELVKSEAALLEQTRILQSVLDGMSEGVVVVDRDGRPIVFNPAAEQILGRDSGLDSEDMWNPRYTVYHSDRRTPYSQEELPLHRASRGESIDHLEVYITQEGVSDGVWMMINGRPLRDGQGRPQGGLVVFHDITRRKNQERSLAVQHATTRVLAESDSLNEAIPLILEIIAQRLDWELGVYWRVDPASHLLRCVTVWHASEAVFSLEDRTRTAAFAPEVDLPGRVWSSRSPVWMAEIAAADDFSRKEAAVNDGLRSAFASPILVRGECLGVMEFFSEDLRPADEELLQMMTNLGSQIGQFIERHQMHTRVVQSEKLASLGMLSAGIAHEINNPLAYIANNLAVLERDTAGFLSLLSAYEVARGAIEESHAGLFEEVDRIAEECDLPYVRQNLDKILASTRQGVRRVAEIVHNLRGFARLDRAAIDQLDIHEALGSAIEMIRGRLQRRRIIVEEAKGDVPLIAASPVQINQVFLNLLVNAMQAIESTHRDDGLISIRTQPLAREVAVEISDNGCGIPPEVLPQIFDPFFTTKGVGDGTGLGLSITHGIIQDHGGRMEVESTPGVGTCFRVVLPISRR